MEEQLRDAANQVDLPTVRRILQQPGVNFNVNAGDENNGWTALHHAVFRRHLAIVQAILQVEGVNANARSGTGCTPLHLACSAMSGDTPLPLLQALLEAGADPNAADSVFGETPLSLAASFKNKIGVEILLDGGANPAARNRALDTPLHTACYQGRLDIAELLIRRDQGSECLMMLRNNREETPLDRLSRVRNWNLEVEASIRQHILQIYAGMLIQRDGLHCLHSVLQDAAFTELAADDGSDNEFQLPVGKLNTEHLQNLLEYIIAAEPGSVRALNGDGLLPLQAACLLNFPALVLHVVLRPYPGALLVL